MGISILLRRVSPDLVAAGADAVEAGFVATEDDSTYEQEQECKILCDLEQQWQMMDALIAGAPHENSSTEYLVVLGGEFLAEVGEPPNSISFLTTEQVRRASHFLQYADVEDLARRNHGALDRLFGGFPEEFLDEARELFEVLKEFYLLASESEQAVVKRSYA
ncbi:DUF1877 family protein [Streptomyces sp. NPDC058657]|uniref:DUF1877 family protein n=1 Tax=unclassified Streptomyces TaxID=2593676 RepID=UPI00365F9224